MNRLSRKYARTIATAFLLATASVFAADIDEKRLSQEQVMADTDAFFSFIRSTHPQLDYTTSLEELDRMENHIRASLTASMSVREFWAVLAQANPVFHDAHVGLIRPTKAAEDHFQRGGALFPGKVQFDRQGNVHLVTAGGDNLQIVAINDIPIEDIWNQLRPRLRGESEELAREIARRYFDEFFWALYGGFEEYRVLVQDENGMRDELVLGNQSTEATDGPSTHFSLSWLSDEIPVMQIDSFDLSLEEEFAVFLEQSFAALQAAGAETLVIDLRANGGGARELSDRLMAYLTDQPYSPISGVTARITEENISRIPGAELGAVVKLPFRQTVQPPAELPNRFHGQVYALVGPATYSQAIVFAATLQDHGLALIAGEETVGRANQTGQVQRFELPNSGLIAAAPIYIFLRASGEASDRGVIPDISLSDDPLDWFLSPGLR